MSSIDYMSTLNKSMKAKNKIDGVRDNIGNELWNALVDSAITDNEKERRVLTLSEQIRKWPETMKVRLSLILEHLAKEWLLNPWSIKSLSEAEIRAVAWSEDEKKIKNIINYIVDSWREDDKKLSSDQLLKLNQAVIEGLDKYYWEAAEEYGNSKAFQKRNDELVAELRASEKTDEVVETALLERWSRNRIMRVGKAIQKTVNDTSLKEEDRDRKVLWQANSSAISGRWRRFDWINKLPSKIDANEEYKKSMDNLKKKMRDPQTKRDEKVVIRYIAKQVTRHYSDYVERTVVDEDTRRQNVQDINTLMAAA